MLALAHPTLYRATKNPLQRRTALTIASLLAMIIILTR